MKYGKNEVAIAIDGARSVQTLTENPMNTIEDIHAAFLKAITEDTIESPALKQLVASDDKITIIISDMTRFWMHQDIICEELVRYLNEAIGIPFEHIAPAKNSRACGHALPVAACVRLSFMLPPYLVPDCRPNLRSSWAIPTVRACSPTPTSEFEVA